MRRRVEPRRRRRDRCAGARGRSHPGVRPAALPAPGSRDARSQEGLPISSPDAGAASVLVIALLAVVVTVSTLVAAVGVQRSAEARTRTAADLAALAAASSVAAPAGVRLTAEAVPGDHVCGLAADVAARNDGALVRCTVLDGGVVEVEVRGPRPATRLSTARAGPRE